MRANASEQFGGDSDLSDVGEDDILPQAERTPTPGSEEASGGEERSFEGAAFVATNPPTPSWYQFSATKGSNPFAFASL